MELLHNKFARIAVYGVILIMLSIAVPALATMMDEPWPYAGLTKVAFWFGVITSAVGVGFLIGSKSAVDKR